MSLASWFREVFPPGPDLMVDTGALKIGLAKLQQSKPRLATVRTAPSRDEFAAWRDDPTTQFVMAALARNAEECREKWLNDSWGAGNADQRLLDALRERTDALDGFTAHYEAFCDVLGLEPEPEGQE